jgi:glycosyltransferase involved in cell wall biosynthesis
MLPAGVPLITAPTLEFLRRLAPRLPFMPRVDVAIGRAFGRFAAANMPAEADIFVGWSGASLEAIPVARQRGMHVVLERGSSHIAHQAEILAEAHAEFGDSQGPVDERMIERELAEYAAADMIAVPTRFAAGTFVARGVPQSKLMINPYGADLARFDAVSPAERTTSHCRVLFVGEVGVRKGVPWLLRAFDRLDASFELHLVGPVTPQVRHLLSTTSDRIHVHGPLRSTALDRAFATADLFCLPSLEEGLPLALLQAMAAGLPIIATPECGARDVITEGVEGSIVPARNADALAAALTSMAAQPRRQIMGTAAQARVADGFSWAAYGNRAVAAYQGLLARV